MRKITAKDKADTMLYKMYYEELFAALSLIKNGGICGCHCSKVRFIGCIMDYLVSVCFSLWFQIVCSC